MIKDLLSFDRLFDASLDDGIQFPSMFYEGQPFDVHLNDKPVVIEPVKLIVSYDYDRRGNVIFVKAGRWNGNQNVLVDDLGGGTTQDG